MCAQEKKRTVLSQIGVPKVRVHLFHGYETKILMCVCVLACVRARARACVCVCPIPSPVPRDAE